MAMIDVFVRPPSESCRILVSFDSLEDKNTSVQFKKARESSSQPGSLRSHTWVGLEKQGQVNVLTASKGHFRKSLNSFLAFPGALGAVERLDRPHLWPDVCEEGPAPVWDVRPLLHQSSDDSAQSQQRLVDVSCFTSALVHRT